MISASGKTAICQRVESKALWKTAGWVHRLDQPVPPPPPERVKPKLPLSEINRLVERWQRDIHPAVLHGLGESLSVTGASLQRLGVGWNRERFGGPCFTFPMRSVSGGYCGARFRLPNGEKRTLSGGYEGLFIPRGDISGPILFIVEGPTDTAALMDLRLNAVGRPNDRGGVEEVVTLVRRLRMPRVVIVCDNDRKNQGVRGGALVWNALASLTRLSMIRPVLHKDAREFVAFGGGRGVIVDAANGNRNNYWEPIE